MAKKGDSWNESEIYRDPMTLRQVRRVTQHGIYNETPTYHTNVAFTADGEFLVFGSAREGTSVILRCHVPTGELTQLIDPVEGMGGYNHLHKYSGVAVGNGMGVTGTMCIAPNSRWAVFIDGRRLRAVHLETLQELELIADIGLAWVPGVPSIDPGERHVILPVMSAHPELVAGRRMTRPYRDHFAQGGMQMKLLQVPLAGGEVTTVYEEADLGCAHAPHSPSDPDLVLIDRDLPPNFWAGSDGTTNRIWTLRLSTGELTELPSQDDAHFQVHSVWTWDGEHVLYHGRSAKSGHYIGVIGKDGQPVREYGFYDAPHYGHVSAMAGRPAIILDGNLTNDLLLWLSYDQEEPRIEIIARHGTDWGALPGQFSHPHPHSDPTGRWISFNAAHKGRSDVFIVSV